MRARFATSARDAITLEFDQPVRWNEALASQFRLDGGKAAFSSSSADGATVTLRLMAPTDARTVSYIDGERWSQSTILRGENGIAALTFCEVVIKPVN
jgi:hypothetical protein